MFSRIRVWHSIVWALFELYPSCHYLSLGRNAMSRNISEMIASLNLFSCLNMTLALKDSCMSRSTQSPSPCLRSKSNLCCRSFSSCFEVYGSLVWLALVAGDQLWATQSVHSSLPQVPCMPRCSGLAGWPARGPPEVFGFETWTLHNPQLLQSDLHKC